MKKFIGGSYQTSISVLLIGILAFVGSVAMGFLQGISEPQIHDEFSYLLAADTFAHGRLTNPTHPMWVHFETIHVIHQPSYMSKFMPAQGLFLALGSVFAGHPIVGVWLSMATMCAATCWMLHAWVPRHWAILGGFFTVIHPITGIGGYWAQSYWGGAVAATGGALLLGGARNLMRQPRVADAIATGIGVAIVANSRPYEGLVLTLPVGAMLLWQLAGRHRPAFDNTMRQIVFPLGIIGVLTLAGMAFYNFCVAGSIFQLPYLLHEQTYTVSPLFVWQRLPPTPTYRHDIIRDFHAGFELSVYVAKHSLLGFIDANLAALVFFMVFGLSVFAIPLMGSFRSLLPWIWKNQWGRFALLTYITFVCGIMIETHNRLHYWAPITALNYVFVLQGMRLWRARHPCLGRAAIYIVPLLALLLLFIISFQSTRVQDEFAPYRQRARLLDRLARQDGRHLVLVRYGPKHSYHFEWVYNEADIDRSKVVWAREMDLKDNCRLVQYFKDRMIWSLKIDYDEAPVKLNPFSMQSCR
jgi:hypothetical protein